MWGEDDSCPSAVRQVCLLQVVSVDAATHDEEDAAVAAEVWKQIAAQVSNWRRGLKNQIHLNRHPNFHEQRIHC